MRSSLFVIISLAACTGQREFSRFERINGAPISNRGIGFDSKGRAILAGLGEGYVFTREGDWATVGYTGVPSYQLTPFVSVGDTLYATLTTQLLKLDEGDAFTWTQIDPDYGSLFGADGAGRLYEWGGNATDIRRLAEGDTEWTRVGYGDFPLGGRTVTPDGTVFFDRVGSGLIYRATPETGTTVVADCATTEGCAGFGFGVAGSDSDGNVYLLQCPQIYEGRDNRFVWKIAHGTETPTKIATIPVEYPYCIKLQPLPDGTLFLVIATDNLTTGTLAFMTLSPGDDSFEVVTNDGDVEWGYQYVARDSSTVYGWGDGEAQGGLIRATR